MTNYPDGLLDVTLPSDSVNGIGQEKLFFQEVLITTEDNRTVTAYEVVEVRDANGNTIPIEERHKSNCTGLAVANGEVWIFDSDLPTNETASFENMLADTSLYSSSTTSEGADFVIIWDTPNDGNPRHIVHSGIVNSDGKFTHKDNNGAVKPSQTYTEFVGKRIQPPNSNYETTVLYYKKL